MDDDITTYHRESEFNVPGGTGMDDSTKIGIKDLVSDFRNDESLQDVYKLTKRAYSEGKYVKRPKVVEPLPRRQEERVTRSEAYKQTKEDLKEWQTAVLEVRSADHLQFPLRRPEELYEHGSSLNADFKPVTDLEKGVFNTLKGVDRVPKKAKLGYQLPVNKLDSLKIKSELEQRAIMKELMSRFHAKASRVAKIKSKAYRRIKRRAKEKEALKSLANDAEAAQEEMERVEQERVRERLTLRHKNTGKWAQSMLKAGRRDGETREAMMEQFRKHENLKRKMHNVDGEEAGDEVDEELARMNDPWNDDQTAKQHAVSALKKLAGQKPEELPEEAKKGVYGMKFMQNAMKREYEAAEKELVDLRSELAAMDEKDEEDPRKALTAVKAATKAAQKASKTSGRRTFAGPSHHQTETAVAVLPFQRVPTSEEAPIATENLSSTKVNVEVGTSETSFKQSNQPTKSKRSVRYTDVGETADPPVTGSSGNANPWLVSGARAVETKVVKAVATATGTSIAVAAKKVAMHKHVNEGRVEISDTATLALSDKNAVSRNRQPKSEAPETSDISSGADETSSESDSESSSSDDDDDENQDKDGSEQSSSSSDDDEEDEDVSDDDETNDIPRPIGQRVGFKQRDLIEMAFANDNMVLEEEDDDQDGPNNRSGAPNDSDNLPGWGSWSGAGAAANKPKHSRHSVVSDPKKKAVGAAPADGKRPTNQSAATRRQVRQPFQLNHVEIYAGPLTTGRKYSPVVAYSTDPIVDDDSRQVPLGREWNTEKIYNKVNAPRIRTQAGAIIHPLRKTDKVSSRQ
ncbi:hypothetical protein IWQ60_000658 [Tieghemiomyces parasiticus]|uniref:U3 small nucleolar RNA-associated protein 14 n=1 Tax=Tieghemiomyces parasiticus TaxID=78921 RepID=A0A9W8AKS1_9FUNG|nr:hypothetical protein IWQ60_000658 [Tieghemiomyces parasiticus]